MNWDDLRVLLAVSRAGTMTNAAKALGVSHTTISRRVEALEAATSTRLVRRIERRWGLTPAGQALVDSAARLEHDLLGVERRWLSADASLSGPLRVTTVDMVAAIYADAFAEFAALHPAIELEISTQAHVTDLSRDAEVALRISKAPHEHLIGRRIAHWPHGIYAAESLIARYPNAEIGTMPWIGWRTDLGARVTEQWMRTHVPDAPVVARVDSPALFMSLLQHGVGLGFAAIPLGESNPALRQFAAAPPSFSVDLWLLTHPDLRETARVRALMDHLARAQPRSAVF